jgi:hypothetical protein
VDVDDGDRGPDDQRRERRHPDPPPKPTPFFVPTKVIPQVTRAILASSVYKQHSAWIISAFAVLRTDSEGKREAKAVELTQKRAHLRGMWDSDNRQEVLAADHLMDLIDALHNGVDLTRPSFFASYYQTGEPYTD